ncbi:MAG: radical protein [Devosia sp.]|nr:radical protein [Devosia sp.]
MLTAEAAKTILSRNESPDLGFDRSINPYRGCEHGCIYCFARPSHAYLGLSPGLDFETKLFFKPNAAELLRHELSKPGYAPERVQLGANTDCYQPVEKRLGITRQVLEVLQEFNHPLGITTKSHLVTRDIDILAPMAKKGLVVVVLSVTMVGKRRSQRTALRYFWQSRAMQEEIAISWSTTHLSLRQNDSYQNIPWTDFKAWAEDYVVIVLFSVGPIFVQFPNGC